MNFMTAVHTDVGIKKKTNQDAVLIKVADTDYGRTLLGVICDGMGGLAKGEVASAALIRAFSSWFEDEFPEILLKGLTRDEVYESWNQLVFDVNLKIGEYGSMHRLSLGTTVTALLLLGNQYYIINVGDSRIYKIKNDFCQLTKDQTYIQREMDLGHMTYQEAMQCPQRNVLLQCVGASAVVSPDFYSGSFEPNTVFMLCSDGFRHVILEEEFYERLNPYVLKSERQMAETAAYFTELNKRRNETDNISVALVRAC